MVEEVEDDILDCKTILIIGAALVGAFALWNFYNTSRLHDLVQQLLNRPEPTPQFYSHDGEHPSPSVVRTHNGRDRGSC